MARYRRAEGGEDFRDEAQFRRLPHAPRAAEPGSPSAIATSPCKLRTSKAELRK
jgi:hypothetical protein